MALILAVSLLAASSPAAIAQNPPGCAIAPDAIEPPAVLTDTDRIVRELRDGRIEAAASCAAVRELLSDVVTSSGAGADDLAELAELAAGETGIAVHETADAAAGPAQTVELAPATLAAVAGEFVGLASVLWFAVGALIALFGGYFLIRRDA